MPNRVARRLLYLVLVAVALQATPLPIRGSELLAFHATPHYLEAAVAAGAVAEIDPRPDALVPFGPAGHADVPHFCRQSPPLPRSGPPSPPAAVLSPGSSLPRPPPRT